MIEQANNQIIRFAGDPIIPKLELLKTYASGRLYGYQAYKDGLDFIALNYPSSEVGKITRICNAVQCHLSLRQLVDVIGSEIFWSH